MFTHLCYGRGAALIVLALLVGCTSPKPTPPHFKSFEGLPISGSLADATSAGFTQCVELPPGLRCRRDGVRLHGQGPYSAAVDLVNRDGSGGFTELTLWDDRDQNAVFAIGEAFEADSWTACLTGNGNRGDFKVWTLKGAPVRLSMDISYWGKRRLRVIPERGQENPRCR